MTNSDGRSPRITKHADEPRRAASTAQGTQTLLRGLHVLEAMASQGRATGVGELARVTDLPKSTVQRLLRTLEQAGWAQVTPDPVTRWQIGPRILSVARSSSANTSIPQAAGPHLARLGEQTGETIHLAVPDGPNRLVLIDRIDSVHAVRTFNAIGASMAMHTSSSGKAFLSRLPEAEAKAILARPLKQATPNTIVDPEVLWAQIESAREVGYALNVAENRLDVCAIGAAIVDSTGRPVATITLSLPQSRYDSPRVPEWGRLVSSTADRISRSL